MLKKRPNEEQQKMELVILSDLVPKDHLLRKMAKAIEFDFIYEMVKALYCADNGRPAVDPVVLFKMLFIGCCETIRITTFSTRTKCFWMSHALS